MHKMTREKCLSTSVVYLVLMEIQCIFIDFENTEKNA